MHIRSRNHSFGSHTVCPLSYRPYAILPIDLHVPAKGSTWFLLPIVSALPSLPTSALLLSVSLVVHLVIGEIVQLLAENWDSTTRCTQDFIIVMTEPSAWDSGVSPLAAHDGLTQCYFSYGYNHFKSRNRQSMTINSCFDLLFSFICTSRSELRKVLFLVPSVCVFCLCIKYLRKC